MFANKLVKSQENEWFYTQQHIFAEKRANTAGRPVCFARRLAKPQEKQIFENCNNNDDDNDISKN